VEGRQSIVAPMPGKVVRILAAAGESVEANQGLLVVEAMKMQNEIRSPKAGKVVEVKVASGEAVNSGQVLLVVE
jgi:biotin carboxyl carrier protein